MADWKNDTLDPLGPESGISILITCEPGEETGLFTFRGGKDTDLTAEQFLVLSQACRRAHDRLMGVTEDRDSGLYGEHGP